jgi:hypothetical protein
VREQHRSPAEQGSNNRELVDAGPTSHHHPSIPLLVGRPPRAKSEPGIIAPCRAVCGRHSGFEPHRPSSPSDNGVPPDATPPYTNGALVAPVRPSSSIVPISYRSTSSSEISLGAVVPLGLAGWLMGGDRLSAFERPVLQATCDASSALSIPARPRAQITW